MILDQGLLGIQKRLDCLSDNRHDAAMKMTDDPSLIDGAGTYWSGREIILLPLHHSM